MAQVTIVITGLPENTPEESIYISGDFEGWSGGNEKYRLNKVDKNYMITLPEREDAIKFKFTKGSWDTVEVKADGGQTDNRAYSFMNKNDTLKVKIEQWSDGLTKVSTATTNVKLLARDFYLPGLDKNRTIWIYLPPSYNISSQRFPVIYMHDGQNLFDDALAFSGEWEVDETLDRLSKEKDLNLIVVGIENGGVERINEYTPWNLPKYPAEAKGDAYITSITETLKPFVDDHYRTLPDSENTAIMGSSLGGLISHYAALKNPEIFGKSGVFSPSFELSPSSFDFAKRQSNITSSKMYVMAGDHESDMMDEKMTEMIELMTSEGFPASKLNLKIVPGGEHNETLWKNEFEEAVLWLFSTK
jgi:predicted alpha/beta superfamily hydrolase